MPLSAVSGRIAPLAFAIVLGLGLAGCTSGLIMNKTQGYDLSEDALSQIRLAFVQIKGTAVDDA